MVLLNTPGGFSGAAFWFAVDDQIAEALLDTLNDLKPKLTKTFGTPRTLASNACGSIMPGSYKSMLSPFYAFYLNCRDFANTLTEVGFIDPSPLPVSKGASFSQSPDLWANANVAGLYWGEKKTQAVPCPDYSCSDMIYERPWWASYDPHYAWSSENGGEKFDPGSYNYVSPYGGRVRYQATGRTIQPYWYFLQCLIPAADKEINRNPHLSAYQLGENVKEACMLPALETACELYGEGDDLEAQWEARWGIVPSISGYLFYCAWAEELRNEGKYGTLTIEQ